MQASLTVQGTAPLTCMIRDQLYTLGGPVRAAGQRAWASHGSELWQEVEVPQEGYCTGGIYCCLINYPQT